MKAEPRIHFAGALEYNDRRGYRCTVFPGWAACCSDLRAKAIRERGNHTYDKSKVTCAHCRVLIAKADRQ
jgi:hypothetical protein